MRSIIDIILSILFLSWGVDVAYETIYKPIKKAAIIQLHKGVPPLTPFTRKMTGSEGED